MAAAPAPLAGPARLAGRPIADPGCRRANGSPRRVQATSAPARIVRLQPGSAARPRPAAPVNAALRFVTMARLLALPLILAWLSVPAAAQQALVLSGGGSRGLAHAGVLIALEEAGRDPAIVVGTSMGAVVGALYAAGYTSEEIIKRVQEVDWSEAFTVTALVIGPDRAALYPMVTFDIDTDELRFARGLVAQWRINRVLARLLFDANARARGDFDRLARRYRAVAADLRTGEVVVLSAGDLARAARASMAVPGLFAPVVWEDRVLVDGGIANNLPTDVARALGAGHVVAVDAGRAPDEIHDSSPLGVIQRAIDLMQENTHRDRPADELILPDLDPSFGGTTFPSDPSPLFAAGLSAARRDLGPAPPTSAGGERPLALPPDRFARLVVEAPDSSLAALGRRYFSTAAPGPYDTAAVLRAVDLLYTTGLFEAVWPRVTEDPVTGEASLVVRLDSPPRVSLGAGAGYENDRGARAWASISRYTSVARRPAVLTGSAASTGLERWAAVSLQVFPRVRPPVTWSVGAHLKETDVRVFTAADAIGDADAVRMGGWAAFELPHILKDRLATLTFRGEWVDVEGGPRGSAYGPVLRFSGLNPDAMIVGEPLLAEAEHRWGEVPYSRVALRGSAEFQAGDLAAAALADLVWTTAGAPDDSRPALGDEHLVPGLQWGEERGATRAVIGGDIAYPIRTGFARLRLRSGAVAADPAALERARWVSGAQIGLFWRSPLGSAEIGYGINTRGDRRFDVGLGRRF
jgi:predicted acylesterase/phospholipase RssA